MACTSAYSNRMKNSTDNDKACQLAKIGMLCIRIFGCADSMKSVLTESEKTIADECALYPSVNSQCDVDTVLSCTKTYNDGIKANGNKLATFCQLSKSYLSCFTTSGCTGYDFMKSYFRKTEQKVNNKCGACQVQISILCLVLMLVAMLFSK
ncbi:uncharacterized protein LOC121368316 isoform X2 [Gigantopelta aegis]|nr:uncharacterized protein LOC121368316 isoform X2 [Gigantopelta aegis]